MKNSFILLLVAIALAFTACSFDSVENDANKLAKIACEANRTQDLGRREELKNQYRELEKEIKIRYKDREADAIRLFDLYLKKLKDCLGYIPVN